MSGGDRTGSRHDIVPVSDCDIVISYQSERELWYVHHGADTAVVSAEDMVHEYYRWRYAGAPGEWRDHAEDFCRKRLASAGRVSKSYCGG
jgi:hypothetical protein